MTSADSAQALKRFREHVDELSATWYEGDTRAAFRHAAFQQAVPDPNLSDTQVIELTAIDKSGDLEIDGWFDDDTSEVFFLFQAVGGGNRVVEASLTKFWVAPQEILDPVRISATRNQSVLELSKILDERLKQDYSLKMVFAAKGGFAPSARQFAQSKTHTERPLVLTDGTRITCSCTLELVDEEDLAKTFDDYRAGFRGDTTDVEIETGQGLTHVVENIGSRSLRATVAASEIVRIFRLPGMGYRLFSLNPRGPLANAKINKNISASLNTPEGRRTFHLLNNGLCATCSDFGFDNGRLFTKNFQIVNGCQTTVTLNSRSDVELNETLVDLKLAIADQNLAERIAVASNSQTALRARDYASFERQQRQLQGDFAELQPPWYYEIKQGYWRFVLGEAEKARFKTGQRKRHIEVQPLAQAALAFIGFPAEALDRVRFVFQAIRSADERVWYERAFPSSVRVQQLLVPWYLLDLIQKEVEREKFSTFHILWLVASILRDHYQIGVSDYFSPEMSSRLVTPGGEWFNGMFRVSNNGCKNALRRAERIMGHQIQLRDFFRASGELIPGVVPKDLLREAVNEELVIAAENNRDPRVALPG
jgi:hypothetical protein